MNIASTLNRDEILIKAKIESELSDLKQHADKMIRGFENFNNYSSNRAVWELVQNACDLTAQCQITLDYRNNVFSFTHNGKPFTTKSFISLIKQVSGKYGEEVDVPEVGKYGTGFLTTHAFGRKFRINSILEADNSYFEIKDFLIDRSPKEWKELSENIRTQKDQVYQLIEEGTVLHEPQIETTFTFFPGTEQEHTYIAQSSKDLEDYIPIVLTINERLKKVNIILEDNSKATFERASKKRIANEEGIELYKTIVSKDGVDVILYSIIDIDDQIEVILPINKSHESFQFSERVARLFLYYPLIGSEEFGINFIVNCNKFLPTEPRDGIHLKSNKDQVRDQEEENQRILEKASQLIFQFLKSDVLPVSNPLLYAQINFKRNTDNNLLNEYFEELQRVWLREYSVLPIVETSEGFKPVSEVCFFDEELLRNGEAFDDIYALASLFFDNIPTKDKVFLWSKFASEWTDENTVFIGHLNLVEKISNEDLSKFDKSNLMNYYHILLDEKNINYFSEHTLLPNLDGKFYRLAALFLVENLTESLIAIGKAIIPETVEKFIHKDFYLGLPLNSFNRKDFSNSIKNKLDEVQASACVYVSEAACTELYDSKSLNNIRKVGTEFFENLLRYCRLSNNVNSQSKPLTLVKLISRYYSLDEHLIELPALEDQDQNLEMRSARKILVQIFFNLLQHHNEDWVKSNIDLLLEIAHCYEDSYKEVYSTSSIFPNQLNQLKSSSELKRDINVSTEIKDLYTKVTRDDIREHLVYVEFNEFIAEDSYVTNKYLSNQIEDTFFNTDVLKINDHPFKAEILNIIKSLRDEKYAELFPRLDDKKATLMLEVVTNEKTKADIFSIVTLRVEDIMKLGELVQKDNFSAILDAASKLLQEQKESRVDFHHKYLIGTYIEDIIRRKLSADLANRVSFANQGDVAASDVQGGQDIVVSIDSIPIYFIEVKSRWDNKKSVSMSKLQLQRAVEESDRYALCSVDVTRYTGENDRYALSTDEILPLTKFVGNIGDDIRGLIEDNLEAEKSQEEAIHLVDYRGIIPQDVIQRGSDFDSFFVSLLDAIETYEATAAVQGCAPEF